MLLALASLIHTGHASAQSATDFSNWYRIELIIFKQKRPEIGNEMWLPESARYPTDMVAISPFDDASLTPYNLAQLAVLEQSNGILKEPAGAMSTDASFLFENRANDQLNRDLIRVDADPNESAGASATIDDNNQPGYDQSIPGSPDNVDPEGIRLDSELTADFTASQEAQRRVDELSTLTRIDQAFNTPQPQAFRQLEANDQNMSDLARSLRRSSRYDVLMHQAWLQPLSVKPTPILIQAGDHFDDHFEVDGTLSFSRTRFLHLQADLWFTQFESTQTEAQFMRVLPNETLPLTASNYPELITLAQNRDAYVPIQTLSLRHARRMRSSVLHFIDHPYFGILVRIDEFSHDTDTTAE